MSNQVTDISTQKQTPSKRRSAQECIAFRLGWNITDVSDNRYQAGKQSVPVYTIGDTYMCCPPAGGKPPKGWNWEPDGDAYGRQIYSAGTKPTDD